MLNRPAHIGVVLILAAFLIAGTSGLPHLGMDMPMESGGQMSSVNCFMPGMTEALCQMNPLQHIATWQNMFAAVPSQGSILTLLLALLALALGALLLYSYRGAAPPRVLVFQPSFAYYKRYIPFTDPLQEAFSNGILHPKIF